jgi:hypothetical protein
MALGTFVCRNRIAGIKSDRAPTLEAEISANAEKAA